VGSVDRRFNRARYEADAARTAFAAGLEDVEDLDSIRHDLATLVRQAREPPVPIWISQRLRLTSATSPPPSSLSVVMRATR
jgi:hypothetical protein